MAEHKPFAAVIFDMDGVLVESEPLHFAALNRVLAAEGHAITDEDNRQFIGTTLRDTMLGVIRLFDLREPIEHYEARYEREVLDVLRGPLTPAPGARELLRATAAAGLKLGLASSSRRSWIDATLASLYFTGYFPVVVSGDEVRRGKPDPEIFLRAAALLSEPPEDCVVLEDSPKGIAAAVAAGMTAIAVRTPFTDGLSLAGAHLVVDSLADGTTLRFLRLG